jgi:hypothetical protein
MYGTVPIASVVDRLLFNANPDPGPNFHFDAYPDPNPDPGCHQNGADQHLNPSPTFIQVGK